MFLALALGMLIGSALVGSPSTDRQQKELRALQQSFTQFNKQFGELREQSDNLKERLGRSDSAIRDLMRPHVANRLPGMRIAVILCGEQADTNFLRELEETVQDAGGTWSASHASATTGFPFIPKPGPVWPMRSDCGLTPPMNNWPGYWPAPWPGGTERR